MSGFNFEIFCMFTPDFGEPSQFLFEGQSQDVFGLESSLLDFTGGILNNSPIELFSGGGQGRAPQPPCKREGSQKRARRGKRIIPQLPMPPKPPKKGK